MHEVMDPQARLPRCGTPLLMDFLGLHHRSIAQRRRPLPVRSRLHELRCRARPRLPSAIRPAQHQSPHVPCFGLPHTSRTAVLIRRHSHHPRRQRLEPLVAHVPTNTAPRRKHGSYISWTHTLGCRAAARLCPKEFIGLYRRSTGQRRRPIEVRSRLYELRCRARPRLPSA